MTVRVFGPDFGQLLALGETVRAAIDTVPGVVNSRVSQAPFEPTIQVEVDLDAAFAHGVRPGDVRRAAATLVNGLEVGNLFEEQKVFEVMVVGVPDLRHSVESVAAMAIDTPAGAQVPLNAIADVRLVPAPTRIDRSGISRYIDIAAGVEGRDVADVRLPRSPPCSVRSTFPLEYHAQLGDRRGRPADGAEHASASPPSPRHWACCSCSRQRSTAGGWRGRRWSSSPWPLAAVSSRASSPGTG